MVVHTLYFPTIGKSFNPLTASPPVTDPLDAGARILKLAEEEARARAEYVASLNPGSMSEEEIATLARKLVDVAPKYSPDPLYHDPQNAIDRANKLTDEQKASPEYQEYLEKVAKYEKVKAGDPWLEWPEYPEFAPLPPEEKRSKGLKAMLRYEARLKERKARDYPNGRPTVAEMKAAHDAEAHTYPKYRSLDMKVRKLSSIGYLHLAYFTAEITLHRRIVRSFDNPHISANDTSEARRVCRAAARTRFMFALQFIENLRPIHLQSFWYFSSSMDLALIGSFGMLLWATASSDREEAEFYKERIRDLKWGIRVNCKTAEFMEVGLGRLEVVTAMLGE